MPINDLKLREAKPCDHPHILLWDTPNDLELRQIAYRENAECISYRKNILSRTPKQSRFLALHMQLDKELDAIKSICADTNKPVLLLKDLDCLITYLHIQPGTPITHFWQSLYITRYLKSTLWIILPSRLAPTIWDESRMHRI